VRQANDRWPIKQDYREYSSSLGRIADHDLVHEPGALGEKAAMETDAV